jgi:hypothetical protein
MSNCKQRLTRVQAEVDTCARRQIAEAEMLQETIDSDEDAHISNTLATH